MHLGSVSRVMLKSGRKGWCHWQVDRSIIMVREALLTANKNGDWAEVTETTPNRSLTIGDVDALSSTPCELIDEPALDGPKACKPGVHCRLYCLNLQT